MRKINAIIKGITDHLANGRKADRVLRQVDQAIDMAKDKADAEQDKATELLERLGEYSGAEQTKELNDQLNEYKNHMLAKQEWENCAEIFTNLKAELSKEIPDEKEK